jgi:hypothetical protein
VTARSAMPSSAPASDAQLDAQLDALPVPTPPPLSAALEAELGRLQPVTPRRPWRQLAILVALSSIYGTGLVAVLALRPDVLELPMYWLAGVGLAWLLGFLVPMYFATVPRRGAMLPRWQLAGAAAVAVSVLFVLLGLTLHPEGPHSVHLDHFGGYGCLEVGLATALVPVVLGAIFLRGALPVGSRWTAAALGAGGGSLGGLVLHLHCRIVDGLHVGIIHGGVVVLAALIAAALVPRATDAR